jgi:hypothetical protein
VRRRASYDVRYLSAGALTLSWRTESGEPATIAGKITVPAGKGWLGLIPGADVNGNAGQELPLSSGGTITAGEVPLSFKLGAIKGALDPRGARVTYWYTDWSNVASSVGTIEIDVWAIPQLQNVVVVKKADGSRQLSWRPSLLEAEKDVFREYELFARSAKGVLAPLGTAPAGTTVFTLEGPKIGSNPEACVRAADRSSNTGPEACASLAPGLVLKFDQGSAPTTNWQQPMCRYTLTPCNGRAPYQYVWTVDRDPPKRGEASRVVPCNTWFRVDVVDANGVKGYSSMFSPGRKVCPQSVE